MRRALGLVAQFVVVVLCAPFYAIVIPGFILWEAIQQRRGVRLGQERSHWASPDVRRDFLVVDVSRAGEGLVGVRRRAVHVRELRGGTLPAYAEVVEVIPTSRFWAPEPFLGRGARWGFWRMKRTVCVNERR